jgi:hypothetical protein
MSASPTRPSDNRMLAARHVLWVAEAALGRLRKTVPSGGLVDDGFVFLLENPNELEEIVAELTTGATSEARQGRSLLAPEPPPEDLVQRLDLAQRLLPRFDEASPPRGRARA